MNNHFQFGEGFEELKKMAEHFGECIKNAAEDAGWQEGFNPFRDDAGAGPKTGFKSAPHFGKYQSFRHHPIFNAGAAPRSNTYITEDGSLVFEFLMAGFEQSSIDLRFKGDSMVLSARLQRSAANQDDIRYMHRGFSLNDFDRCVYAVPADRYDQAKAKASMRNGILTVTIPVKDDSNDPTWVRVEIVKDSI